MKRSLLQIIVTLVLFTLFLGCTKPKENDKTIKIVLSNWVGYAPLIYAYENGDLKNLNIEIIVTTSLQSSVLMYQKNSLDGICSTKKEIEYINENIDKKYNLIPISIFDRSYGGDVILSDTPKEELFKNKYPKINVFLEKNSINEVVFDKFKDMTKWDTKYFIHNINQYNLIELNCNNNIIPKLLISYEPYASKLKQKGFHLIESTKNDKLLVFDFLSIKNNTFKKDQIKELQSIINDSILLLQTDPKTIYKEVKFYYDDISFEEFKNALQTIQLFSKKNKNKFLSLIQQQNLCNNTKYLKEQ